MVRFLVLAVCVVLSSCQAPPSPGRADVATGEAAFRGQCAACHNADSRRKKVGPGLKGLFHQDRMTDGKNLTEAGIRGKIEGGGNGMPPFRDALSGREEDDLIAYLKTL